MQVYQVVYSPTHRSLICSLEMDGISFDVVIKFVSHLSNRVFNNYFQSCCQTVLQFNHCCWKSRHTNPNGVFYKPNHHKKQSDNTVWWSWRPEMQGWIVWSDTANLSLRHSVFFLSILLHQSSIKVMTQLVNEVILIHLKNLPITLQLIVKSDFFTSSNWAFAEKTDTKFSIDSPLKNGISFI